MEPPLRGGGGERVVGAGVPVEQDVELLPELMSKKSQPEQNKPRRKPSHGIAYSPEIAERILDGLARGMGLKTVCKDPALPEASAVRQWVMDDVDGFASRYARARAIGLDNMAEEIIDIADEAPRMTATQNGVQIDGGDVSNRKLRIDSRKWLLAKILPKKYGDKVEVEQTGEVKHTVSFK